MFKKSLFEKDGVWIRMDIEEVYTDYPTEKRISGAVIHNEFGAVDFIKPEKIEEKYNTLVEEFGNPEKIGNEEINL